MRDIGLVLKNGRENKELTQKRVMELTGINSKSLSGYENNVAEPDLKTLADLANLYEISIDDVLEIKSTESSCILSKSEKRLLYLFNSLDSEHQKEFLVIMEALVKHLQKTKHPG